MSDQQRLFSYKLTHDAGFAPNPFGGYLTLATCKPGIRKSKRVGDWIAGFTSFGLARDPVGRERLIFLMQIKTILSFADYYRDRRFAFKIPVARSKDPYNASGDNIYKPLVRDPRGDPDFAQNPRAYHGPGETHHDLSGKNVLVATRFAYFGRGAIKVPPGVRPRVPLGQHPYGWRTLDPERVDRFIRYVDGVAGLGGVVVDLPTDWSGAEAPCSRQTIRCPPGVKPPPCGARKTC